MKNQYKSKAGHNLTLNDLKEGHFYSGSLTVNHEVKTNECLYTVIGGKLMIHRSANWEDISRNNLQPQSFMEDTSFKWTDAPCFKEIEQEKTYGDKF